MSRSIAIESQSGFFAPVLARKLCICVLLNRFVLRCRILSVIALLSSAVSAPISMHLHPCPNLEISISRLD